MSYFKLVPVPSGEPVDYMQLAGYLAMGRWEGHGKAALVEKNPPCIAL